MQKSSRAVLTRCTIADIVRTTYSEHIQLAMNLLCLVFGHKSLQGIYSGAEYMRVVPGAIDGIGREHARLYATCPRCEREYSAGAIHLPPRALERALGPRAALITPAAFQAGGVAKLDPYAPPAAAVEGASS